jgi:hypothetical protein
MFTQTLIITFIPKKNPLKSNKRFRFYSSINQKKNLYFFLFSNLNDQLFHGVSLDFVKNLLCKESGERLKRKKKSPAFILYNKPIERFQTYITTKNPNDFSQANNTRKKSRVEVKNAYKVSRDAMKKEKRSLVRAFKYEI